MRTGKPIWSCQSPLKARADRDYPGLVKGIFLAKGNYNQDLAPRSILIEFGTHETSLDMAAKAADLIADVLPKATGTARGSIERAAARSTGWLIALVIVGAVGFVLLNAVGWRGSGISSVGSSAWRHRSQRQETGERS